MNPANNNRQPDSEPPREDFKNEAAKNNESGSNQDLFDQILSETKEAAGGKEYLEMIVGFCRSHPGHEELDMEIMLGIVKLILAKKFPSQEFPEGCDEWIAEVLFYDPASRQQIEELWNQAHLRTL